MTDDLIAYLMDDLSPERRAEVDAKLETDVVWRWELDRLRECMAASGDVQQCAKSSPAPSDPVEASHVDVSPADVEPPVDLVKKTCCFVEDSASGKFKIEKKRCKKKAAFSAETCHSGGRPWSLADVTVGAGVLLILTALIMPAIQESQAASRRGTCAFNLRGLGMASEKYADLNNGLLPEVLPGQPAVYYLTRMVEGGVLTEAEALEVGACPDSEAARRRSQEKLKLRVPTSEELALATGDELLQLIAASGMSFAVPVGYFDDKGQHHPSRFTAHSERPMIADAPVIGPMGIRPVSHGGCTQNVLSEAGCVKPYSVCVLPGEDARVRDIHLNDQGIPAAGNSPDDLFLAPPNYGPDGPIASGQAKSVIRVQVRFFLPLVR
jgi:hypothetical protein